MVEQVYTLSFTAGSALLNKTMVIATLFVELQDWHKVKAKVLAENLLQVRMSSAAKCISREIVNRIKKLTSDEVFLLIKGSHRLQQQLVWLSICRNYRLIYDFTVEVIGSHFASSRFLLAGADYNAFFHQKAQWHSNLERATVATQAKTRQVLFRMLCELALTNSHHEILPQRLEPKLLKVLSQNKAELAIFPGVDNWYERPV